MQNLFSGRFKIFGKKTKIKGENFKKTKSDPEKKIKEFAKRNYRTKKEKKNDKIKI